MPTYSFDSSAFINPFRRYYPQDLFPKFWETLSIKTASGEIVSSEVVRDEIDKKDDELKAWVRNQAGLFVSVDEDQQGVVAEIMAQFPTWIDVESSKNNADPFVIALAKVKGLAVVQDEGNGSEENPKIPFVCRRFGVRCLKVTDFIREIGLRFT